MLIHSTKSVELQTRMLTDNPYTNTMCLGCGNCPQRSACGGLSVEAQVMDCMHSCCGGRASCTKVCPRKSATFVRQAKEILGFDLDNTPRAPTRSAILDQDVIELIYHGSRRIKPLYADYVALRLADVVNFIDKKPKFATGDELRNAFRLTPECRIILSGVDHDNRIEPWWSLGVARPAIIKGLVAMGIELVTSPNFSLILDHPRWDDLHAMKRIALVFAEFQENGLACALHPNGRTFQDFTRWKRFIADRPEVQFLSYEFITGTNRLSRRQFHLDGLAEIANCANRPLDIIVRGNPKVIPLLRNYFRRVIYIDTTAFMKTHKRRSAVRFANDSLEWNPVETPRGSPLDSLLGENIEEQRAYLHAAYYQTSPTATPIKRGAL